MRAQVSFEYIVLLGVIMAMAIPSIYLFRSFASESNDKIISQDIERDAGIILDAAKQANGLGESARLPAKVVMPPMIRQLWIMNNSLEYYLSFSVETASGMQDYTFPSDVPITGGVACTASCPAGFDCTCFPERAFQAGPHEFRLETFRTDVSQYINISLVS